MILDDTSRNSKVIETSSGDKQLENCTFVKGVLLLIIILSHSMVFWRGDWFTAITATSIRPEIRAVVSFVSNFHVYAFTLVSGYLYSYLKYERNKYDKFGKFIFNKVKRLVVPYLCVGVFWVVPFQAFFFKESYIQVVIKLLLGDFNAQLWYILMLFWVFVLIYPVSSIIKKHNWISVFIGLFAYALSILVGKFVSHDFEIINALTHIPCFILGIKLREYHHKRLIRWKIAIILGVCYILLFVMNKYIDGYGTKLWSIISVLTIFLQRIFGASAAFVILQLLGNIIRWKDSKVCGVYFKNSMAVYLLHQQLIYLSLWLLNGIPIFIHIIINFGFSLVLSILISLLLMRFRATRYMIGC